MNIMKNNSIIHLRKTVIAVAIMSIYGHAAAQTASDNDTALDNVAELQPIQVIGSIEKGNSLSLMTQSTTNVTAEQIAQKAHAKVDEAISYESSVLAGFNGNDSRSNWIRVRSLAPSFTIDGTPQTEHSYFGFVPETFGLERIEVFKGASSQLYGATSPGGTINMVTKRPKMTPAGEINIFAGNSSKRGVNVDYSGIANADRSVRYRFVAQYRDADGAQNFTGLKHYYVAPSLTWDIGDRTSITFLSSFQRDFGTQDNGFLPPYGTLIDTPYGKISSKTYFGEPGFDHFDRKSSTIGYEFSHEFYNGWRFDQNYRYKRQDVDIAGVFALFNTGTVVNRSAFALDGHTVTNSVENRLLKEFSGSWFTDTLTLGVDYLHTSMSGSDFSGSAAPMDMFHPVYGSTITANMSPFELKAKEIGYYVQNSLLIDQHWLINAGMRHSKSKNNGQWGGDFSNETSKNTYNVGLTYLADNGLSPYINYAESFKPIYGVNANNDLYRPYEAKQWEVGVKYEPDWLEGSDFTLSYYHLDAENAFVPSGTAYANQALETRSRGIEAQANIKFNDQLDMQLSYTYTDSETDSTPTVSYRTGYVPYNAASAWFNYRFNKQTLPGLTVGIGARYVGKTVDEAANRNHSVPSYIIWDAMAKYQINSNWSAQLNISNLTNKSYVAGCSYWCYYGAERSVLGTLSYKW
ncbi:TonB-dependent siderophore receptor [Pectobacterium cacticida]|uniref:TonB-dependent siderophore receptor n=1 Tax=Pectobacterium cacticida TaxID=69221 RepID=UPI003987CA79